MKELNPKTFFTTVIHKKLPCEFLGGHEWSNYYRASNDRSLLASSHTIRYCKKCNRIELNSYLLPVPGWIDITYPTEFNITKHADTFQWERFWYLSELYSDEFKQRFVNEIKKGYILRMYNE